MELSKDCIRAMAAQSAAAKAASKAALEKARMKQRQEPYTFLEHLQAEYIASNNQIPLGLCNDYMMTKPPEKLTRLINLANDYQEAWRIISNEDLKKSNQRSKKINKLILQKTELSQEDLERRLEAL